MSFVGVGRSLGEFTAACNKSFFPGHLEGDVFAESRPEQPLSDSGKAGGILGALAKVGMQLPACAQPCQHLRSGPASVRSTLVNLET